MELFKENDRIHCFPEKGNFRGITELGWRNFSAAQDPLGCHRHEHCIEVCYVKSGRQYFVIDKEEYEIWGNEIFLTLPGERHSTGSHPRDKSVLYWIIIPLEVKDNFFLNFIPTDIIYIRDSLLNICNRHFQGSLKLQQFFEELYEFWQDRLNKPQTIFYNLVQQIIFELLYLSENSLIPSTQKIDPALSYMQANIKENVSLSELAYKCGISLSRFKHIFKDVVGISPNNYILLKKIELSKELLERNQFSITDIAFELGFSSSQYFSTVFKKFTGMTPKSFLNDTEKNNQPR